jgi:hypothetical protein
MTKSRESVILDGEYFGQMEYDGSRITGNVTPSPVSQLFSAGSSEPGDGKITPTIWTPWFLN